MNKNEATIYVMASFLASYGGIHRCINSSDGSWLHDVPSDIRCNVISTSGVGFGELNPVSSLNKRQRELLELLNEPGSTIILPKKSVSMNDLRQLTGVTGDEFNMFIQGGHD